MKNNPMRNEDQVPEILYELDNPYKSSKGMPGVNFDNSQHNGRHGSPPPHEVGTGGWAEIDFGNSQEGINYDNTQSSPHNRNISMDDNMQWEKKNGVMKDPTNKYIDIHDTNFHEVDLSKHVDCIGMPTANINHNSSTDCYGEY